MCVMGLRKLALLLIITLVVVASTTNFCQALDEPLKVEVDRTVTLTEWGSAIVSDKITVSNIGAKSVNSLTVGFPREYSVFMKGVSATDSKENKLTVELDADKSSPTYWLNVKFSKPIGRDEKEVFTLKAVFDGLLTFKDNKFVFKFAAYPTLPLRVEKFSATAVLPVKSESIGFDGKLGINQSTSGENPTLNYGKGGFLEAYSSDLFSFNFISPNQLLLQSSWAKREVVFSWSGGIRVSDTYHVKNLGSSLPSIELTLPKDYFDIEVSDPFGPGNATIKKAGDKTNISVKPIFSMLRLNQSLTFTLSYSVPPKLCLKQLEWWGLYRFSYKYFSDPKDVVEKLNFKIVLPGGASVTEPSVPAKSLMHQTIVEQSFTNVTPLQDLSFTVQYKYQHFWASLQAVELVAIVEIVLLAFIVVFRFRKPAAAVAAAVPVDKVRGFVELYDERISLKLEVEKMGEDLARGAIPRHEYKRRRKLIEVRLEEVSRLLSKAKGELISLQPRYRDTVARLEKAEAQIDAARASESQIRGQYRAGKVTKETYRAVMEDSRKRIDKAKATIDSITISMREEAG